MSMKSDCFIILISEYASWLGCGDKLEGWGL